MTDIVERLRRKVFRGPTMEASHTRTVEWQAADEIEQNRIDLEEYRRDVEGLRAALESIKDMTDYGTETATWRMIGAIHNVNVLARAALETPKEPK